MGTSLQADATTSQDPSGEGTDGFHSLHGTGEWQETRLLTSSQLRWRGLLWILGVTGVLLLVWSLAGVLFPSRESGPMASSLALLHWMGLGVSALLLGLTLGLTLLPEIDVLALLFEWVGFLLVALYLGMLGALYYGGYTNQMALVFALLIIARGTLLPGGIRGLVPPAALLWFLFVFSIVVLSPAPAVPGKAYLQFALSNAGIGLAFVLAAISARQLEQLRGTLSQSDRLGRYRLIEQFNTRGMSQIYRAWNLLLNQPCILKLMPWSGPNRDQAVEVFRREAELTLRIQSPHVVRMFDFGETETDFYFAMEYLEGISLQTLLKVRGPLPQKRVVYFLQQACLGLAEIHRQGILHQDIKPSNLFLIAQGENYDFIKILDFGIARRLAADEAELAARGKKKIAGTPAYMAPERFRGHGDITSDLYAMGLTAYALLAGAPPFRGASISEYQEFHTRGSLPLDALRQVCPDLALSLEEFLYKATAKGPRSRYASAEEMRQALLVCEEEVGSWTPKEAKEAWDELFSPQRQADDGADLLLEEPEFLPRGSASAPPERPKPQRPQLDAQTVPSFLREGEKSTGEEEGIFSISTEDLDSSKDTPILQHEAMPSSLIGNESPSHSPPPARPTNDKPPARPTNDKPPARPTNDKPPANKEPLSSSKPPANKESVSSGPKTTPQGASQAKPAPKKEASSKDTETKQEKR